MDWAGTFNGITAQQKATAYNSSAEEYIEKSPSAPLSNYNVLVLDQNLKNNSYLTFTNTNVLRTGSFYDANVSGLKTKINTKNNNYFLEAEGVLSNIIEDQENNYSHTWSLSAGKQRGQLAFEPNIMKSRIPTTQMIWAFCELITVDRVKFGEILEILTQK